MATSIPSYKELSNEKLGAVLKDLRGHERVIIADIIVVVAEVDRRQLYTELGYASLYAYLVEELHYSGGSATRRIQAARIFAKNPSVYHKIKTGELTLTQIADNYVQLSAKGEPMLKKLEGLSLADSRFKFRKRKRHFAFRLSDPIATGEFMRQIPPLKNYMKNSKDKWMHVALEYITKLEERNRGLEDAIRKMRGGILAA